MSEPTNTDLKVDIAHLEGKIDALTQTTALQMTGFATRLQDSQTDRVAIHQRLDALEAWQNRLMGAWLVMPAGALALSLYAAGKAAGFIH